MEPVTPRPAATVVVARRPTAGGVEVLALQRSLASRFAPGFVVFPGGAIDARDADLAREWFGDEEHAALACALRELAEETGLTATREGPLQTGGRLPGEPGLPPPGSAQVPQIARWIAPEVVPVRFDARFFALVASHDTAAACDGIEAERVWWASPADLLEAQVRGEVQLMWPTFIMMQALAGCGSVEDVLALRVEQVLPPMTSSGR